jgi:hypothetical protein
MAPQTNRRAVMVAITAICAGCGPDGDPVAGPSEGMPEVDLPAPVGDARLATELLPFQPRVQWSDDGLTIHFLPNVGPPFGVHTLDVSSGQAEEIAPGAGVVLHISGDREFLYYSSGQGSHAIHRIATTGGQPELLATAAQHVFAISSNQRWLAWAGSHVDSIFVRDLETNATSAVAAASVPLSISPDGLQLVHTSPQGAVLTSLVSGESTVLERQGTHVLDVLWGASGAEVLTGTVGLIQIVRPGADETVPIWTAPLTQVVDAAAWSPDGSRFVASVRTICITTCLSRLLSIDAQTGSETVVATANDFIGMARFTPDGQRIAVTSGGRLYVLLLP